jgi:hypothetical protein
MVFVGGDRIEKHGRRSARAVPYDMAGAWQGVVTWVARRNNDPVRDRAVRARPLNARRPGRPWRASESASTYRGRQRAG